MTPSDRFKKFWQKLGPEYPITRGKFKLPIATDFFTLPDNQHDTLVHELSLILGELLAKHGTKEQAVLRAQEAGEERIVPLLTSDYTGIVRFDCVIDAASGEFKILEINCDYPDGLILHDKTVSVLSGSSSTRHQDLLKDLFDENPEISILYSPEAGFVDGYYAEKIALESVFDSEITIGNEINFSEPLTVRRCLEVSKLSAEDCEKLSRLPHTYVNTFALRTLGYKNLLGTLEHPYIPQTITVTKETKDTILSQKDRFILKPVEGCEGHGIFFGKDSSEAEWSTLVENAVSEYYIAQEFISLDRRIVEFYEAGDIKKHSLYYDLCPYFFVKNGTVVGNGYTLMRFSEHPIINVTKGGGIGYHAPY